MPRKKAKRSDGRYEIKRKMPDGSTKHFMGYSVTEAVAKYEAARDAMLQKKEIEAAGPTFKEVADAYKNYITGSTKPVKRGTINAYRKNIPPFVECFGEMHMAEIDAQAITGYWEKMKVDGKSLHTITNARSVLSCIFRYWCANFHGTGNPVLLSEVPVGMKRGKREEPTEEQRKLIDAHPEGCGFWAQLFEYTGLRMGEANGLRWEDVDLEAGFIHVRRAMPWDRNHVYEETLKSENAYRDIPILSPLRPALAEHKRLHKPWEYVLSGTSEPLSRSRYDWEWSMYCRPLGLCTPVQINAKVKGHPDRVRTYYKWRAAVTAHQFRHLYASNLFYAGVPDMVAQKLMGHADIMTTRRVYQQLRESEDQKYYAQLDAYVSGQADQKGLQKKADEMPDQKP